MAENMKITSLLTKAAKSLEEVREILFDCSRECVKDEVKSEWHTAEKLFNLAKNADVLRREALMLISHDAEPTANVASSIGREALRVERNTTLKPARKRKEDYPKYCVRNDSLVKTGLGRDKRTEYEQVVPKVEYDKIIVRISGITVSNREFTAEEIQEGLDCPIYQTYIVLSLLRQQGLLDLPRRGTYSFTSGDTFTSDTRGIWNQLQSS